MLCQIFFWGEGGGGQVSKSAAGVLRFVDDLEMFT